MTHEGDTVGTRVGVVDDHAVVVAGLTAGLGGGPLPATVVASGPTVPRLLDAGSALHVVLLGLGLADGSRPAENVTALTASGARVLLFTACTDVRMVGEAVRAGAAGYLHRSAPLDAVAAAIAAVRVGEQVLPPELRDAVTSDVVPELSQRQREVLVRYTGSDTKLPTVARHLGMRPETLKTHLRRIKVKYAQAGRPAHTRLELYRRAVEDGHHG